METNEIAAALCAAQGTMKPATRTGNNPHYKSRYASLADIWDVAREPLAANGLAVAQLPVSDEVGRIGVTTLLLHKSGQALSSTFFATPQPPTPQGIGSALTYLRRYGLAAMLGIVADDDDDGQAGSQGKIKQEKPSIENGRVQFATWKAAEEFAARAGLDSKEIKAILKKRGATNWKPEYSEVIHDLLKAPEAPAE